MFDLDDNIPVAPIARAAAEIKYPFADMKPGQSFLVPVEIADTITRPEERAEAFKEGAKTLSNRLTGAVRRFKDRDGNGDKVFAVRSVPDEGGVRVWYVSATPAKAAPAKAPAKAAPAKAPAKGK